MLIAALVFLVLFAVWHVRAWQDPQRPDDRRDVDPHAEAIMRLGQPRARGGRRGRRA